MMRILVFVFLILSLGGCGFFKTENKAPLNTDDYKRKESLFLGLFRAPENFDWNKPLDPSATLLVTNVMEGLTRLQTISGQVTVEPALAKEWTTSADGLQVTFKIRENVKWTNGKILKAQEFIDSLKRLLGPTSPASICNFLFVIKNAEAFHDDKASFADVGIKAPDDNTLVFHLNHSLTYFPAIFAFPGTFPIHNEPSDPMKTVTLGAYKFSAINLHYGVLTRHDKYYGHKPSIKNLVFRFNITAAEALRFFTTNQLDIVVDIPPTNASKFMTRPEIINASTLDMIYLGFDVSQKPLSNPIFRRVIGMAIDRKEVLGSINGFGELVSNMIPPHLVGYESNRGVRFDPGAAQTLLKNSGYRNLEKIQPIVFKIGDSGDFDELAENITAQLKRNLEIDIKVVRENFKGKTLTKEGPTMYISHWQATVPDPDNFMTLFKSTSRLNINGWKNRDFDEFVRRAAIDSSVEKRERTYAKAQHILTEEEIPVVPLLMKKRFFLLNERVHGLYSNILNHLVLKEASLE
jgi:oligopeptide transport system substrate-binding protein